MQGMFLTSDLGREAEVHFNVHRNLNIVLAYKQNLNL